MYLKVRKLRKLIIKVNTYMRVKIILTVDAYFTSIFLTENSS